jgi:phosphoenolpyruvate synthase/pyruvate phosphate dikinase
MKATKQRSIMAEFINADKESEMMYFYVTNARNYKDLSEFEVMALMDMQDKILSVVTAHNVIYDLRDDKSIAPRASLEKLAHALNDEFNALIDIFYDDLSIRNGSYIEAETYAA